MMKNIELAESLQKSLGKNSTNRVFSELAKEYPNGIQNQSLKFVPATGTISTTGTVNIKRNTHFGK